MRESLFVLRTAAAAVVCCLGVSILAAAGGTAVLGMAGVALPAAALIGIGGWTAWYLVRHREELSPMTNKQPIVYIDLGVGGMTCDDCVVHVTEALESVPGVAKADVDLATRRAVVTAQADVEGSELASAVRATGQYNAFERRRRTTADA